MNTTYPLLKFWLFYLILAYLGIILYAHLFFNSLAFHPRKSSYSDTSDVIKVKTEHGSTISAIYLPNKKTDYTVLINHGNAEDLGTMTPFLNMFYHQGFSVFTYDYDGYGTSTGSPTEKNVYADGDAAYNYLTTHLKIPPKNIIVFGRSIGTAIAIHIAAHRPVAGLILESSFLSAFRTMTQIPIIPFDKFNNFDKIKQIHHPILFIHGTHDVTIPFWQGKRLYQKANPPKVFYAVENASHNNIELVAGTNYWQSIHQFIDQNIKK